MTTSPNLKAVIIEDETKARNTLNLLLTEHCEGVTVCAMAEDVPNGVKAILKHKPDLVFLDIELPGFNGFELADFLEEINFEIIFTTAYSEYALKAFQMSAVDYLLKPLQIDQLQAAIDKVLKRQNLQMPERLDVLKGHLLESARKKIALPVAEGFLFVEQEEIIFLEADNTYTTVYFSNGSKVVVSKSLKEFTTIIASPDFFKPHRSYYVNANKIKRYNKQDGGHIVMENEHVIYLARDKKQAFLDFLKERGIV